MTITTPKGAVISPERIAYLRDLAIRLHETRVLECLDAIEELLKKECQCQKR